MGSKYILTPSYYIRSQGELSKKADFSYSYSLTSTVQECCAMSLTLSYLFCGLRVHEAALCLVRYWYVRSSLQPQLQEAFSSHTFIYKILFIPQAGGYLNNNPEIVANTNPVMKGILISNVRCKVLTL